MSSKKEKSKLSPISQAYYTEYSQLASFDKLKWLNLSKFAFKFSNIHRLSNIMMIKHHIEFNKLNFTTASFRLIKDDKSIAYAYLHISLNELKKISDKKIKENAYVSYGPSYTSQDGEYRKGFVRLNVLMELYNKYIDAYEHIENNFIKYMKSGDIELRVDFHSKDKHIKPLQNFIDNNRLPILLYSMMWGDLYWRILDNSAPNHLHYNFKDVMFQKTDNEFYESLSKFIKPEEKTFIQERSNLYKENSSIASTLKLGQKMVPLSVSELNNYKSPYYSVWRELHIDYLISQLIVNIVAPGVPTMGDYFFIYDSDHSLYDNDAMHTKIENSKIAKTIVEELEQSRLKTTQEFNENKKDYQNKEGLYSDKELTFIDNHFKQLSEHIEEAMDYAEEDLVMSGITLCKVSENIGTTLFDFFKTARINFLNTFGPALTDYTTFAKYMFEYAYTLLCLHSKTQVIQGDLHLNNVVLYIANNPKHEENNSVVIYDLSPNIQKRVVEQDIKGSSEEEFEESESKSNKARQKVNITPLDGSMVYKFPHYGTYAGVIDFSRGIMGMEVMIHLFGKEFADEFVLKQKKQIIRIYKRHFPEFYKMHQIKLHEFLSTNFILAFKIISAIDIFRVTTEFLNLIDMESKFIKKPALPTKSLDLVKKMNNIARHYMEEIMEKALLNTITDIPYPDEVIIQQCFSEFQINENNNITDAETPTDIFHYHNELKYDANDEKTMPQIMTIEFNNGLLKKFKMPERDYSEYLGFVPPTDEEIKQKIEKLAVHTKRFKGGDESDSSDGDY